VGVVDLTVSVGRTGADIWFGVGFWTVGDDRAASKNAF